MEVCHREKRHPPLHRLLGTGDARHGLTTRPGRFMQKKFVPKHLDPSIYPLLVYEGNYKINIIKRVSIRITTRYQKG